MFKTKLLEQVITTVFFVQTFTKVLHIWEINKFLGENKHSKPSSSIRLVIKRSWIYHQIFSLVHCYSKKIEIQLRINMMLMFNTTKFSITTQSSFSFLIKFIPNKSSLRSMLKCPPVSNKVFPSSMLRIFPYSTYLIKLSLKLVFKIIF